MILSNRAGLLLMERPYPTLNEGSAFDADAADYFTRANVTDATAKAAINQCIVDLKANSLWSGISLFQIGRSAYNAGSGTTVHDVKSSSINGAFVNSPAWNTAGLRFTGNTQAVTTGLSQSMNASWSAFAVVTDSASDTSADRRVFGTTTANSATLLYLSGTNKAATPVGCYDGTSVATSGATNVNATSLRMLGITYSVTNRQRFYSGASQIATAAVALAAGTHTVQLSTSLGSSGMTDGTLSVALIYGGAELTAGQVSTLYGILKGSICSDQSLP